MNFIIEARQIHRRFETEIGLIHFQNLNFSKINTYTNIFQPLTNHLQKYFQISYASSNIKSYLCIAIGSCLVIAKRD